MIELKNVNFSYGKDEKSSTGNGLRDINLSITEGEIVLLCGKSGCGKTTITRLINGLIPHFYEGNLSGDIIVNNVSVADSSIESLGKSVGSVFQNPRSQFFNVDTLDELAFACENMGMDKETILERINSVIPQLALEKLLKRSLFELSGGEKQRIACGSVATLIPEIMVLDEPSSNLDMMSIRELSKIIRQWKAMGKTVIIAEHRLHYLMEVVDRVVYMDKGKIIKNMTVDDFRKIDPESLRQMGLRQSSFTRLAYEESFTSDENIKVYNLYKKHKQRCLLDIDEFNFPRGAIVGVIGDNGAGKTTLVDNLCGLAKKSSGYMEFCGRRLGGRKRCNKFFAVMQDVNHQLFTETVGDEIMLSKSSNIDDEYTNHIVEELNLKEYLESHPMSLSGGQKQRLAIACALASQREFMVFDEPTSGLDFEHMTKVSNLIKDISNKGKTVIIVSHDPELISATCNHIAYLEKGKLKINSPVKDCKDWLSSYFEL